MRKLKHSNLEGKNWTAEGKVTEVIDERFCNSDYAIVSAGIVEGSYAIKNNNLVGLSVQQIVDCSVSEGN